MIKTSYFRYSVLLIALVVFSVSCASKAQKKQDPEAEILAVSKVLLDSNQQVIKVNAKKYIRLTQEFIASSQDATKAIKYAIQGAEVAVNIGDYQKAIHSYDLIAKQYPHNAKVVSNALFAKAFVLENNLKHIEAAKLIYQSIQEKYPNQEITKSIKATLENLGKSDAELLEMIKQKNK